MAYIGSAPTSVVSRQSSKVYRYTATAGQTVFSGADASNQILDVTPSDTKVHINGLLLEPSDYTLTSSSVTLTTAAAAGDELTVTGFQTFEVADTYDKATADTRYVNASGDTMTGDLQIDNGGALKLVSTSNGGNNIAFTQGYNSYLTASNNFYASVGGNTDLFNIVNGAVGIHQTSPARQLHIGASDNTNHEAVIVLNNGGATGYRAGIEWRYEGNTSPRARISVNASDQDIEFDTAGTKRMEIDASGRVTMPYQPAFNAYRSTDPGASNSYNKMNWSATRFNRGNHFDLSNSRFVAPVGGIYWFGITNNQGSGNGVDSWRLYVNGGSRHIMSYDDNANSWNNSSASLTIELAANDYVEAWWRGDPDYGADWCNFYGHLVG